MIRISVHSRSPPAQLLRRVANKLHKSPICGGTNHENKQITCPVHRLLDY